MTAGMISVPDGVERVAAGAEIEHAVLFVKLIR